MDYVLSTVTPRQRCNIERMVQLNKTMDKCNEDYLERFGCPDPPVPSRSFVEKPFGYTDAVSDDSLTSKVVSLALYDGDKMLFACSGVALQHEATTFPVVSRFVTSKRLVTEFEKNRNRADNLRVNVRLPNKASFDGFLGLYDSHIAIVTSFRFAKVLPVDLHSHIDWQHDLVAVGRAFSSGTLMSTARKPIDILSQQQATDALIPFPCPITEAGLGVPVINLAGDVVGLSIEVDIDKETTWFLPRVALRVHLEYLEKFTPNSTNFREYTLPDGVYSIVPSGFMEDVNYLKSRGYPQPPPLVLEGDGRLFNTFEEEFGQLYGYKDYDCNLDHRSSGEQVWAKLPKEVVTNIGRRVVSVSSYDGDVRYFSCTGLLIKWHKNGKPVILTSASLVRSRVDEDKIDEKLKIKVLLPRKQVVDGTLELYHSDYNIAVISLQKPVFCIRPENIFCTVERTRRVVAIGREAEDGLLMATIGKLVKKRPDEKLNCEDLKLSTCKIKKVGIGGPLVNFDNGYFVGMNFYGETAVTPYLPRAIIVEVLSGIDLPSQRNGPCH
ncbi:unnamed protein product [Triticum turgidum subsp. durum]|uniref:Uncharacterized protein n=1 Tax=Triticum turgidum subsp. durum TaxID=4567 RepID=A0A9R1B3D6_TRITD|nr:unnamed protein product [Triticum turgidum subsp. durum]